MYSTRLRLMTSIERKLSPLEKYNLDVLGLAEDAREDIAHCKKKLDKKVTRVHPKDRPDLSSHQPRADGLTRDADGPTTNNETGRNRSNITEVALARGKAEGTINGAPPISSARNATSRNKSDHCRPPHSQHLPTAKETQESDTTRATSDPRRERTITPNSVPGKENESGEATNDERLRNPRERNSANRNHTSHHRPSQASHPPPQLHHSATEQEERDAHMTNSEAGREGISTNDHAPVPEEGKTQTINGRAVKPS
ncbi:MAG: hypothetical protein LQ352_007622, partial [Teloschistes flavicans]